MADRARVAAVLGGGSWGTALALLLAQDGGTVRLWDRTPAFVAALTTDRENRRYLPGFPLPPAIRPTADIAVAVGSAACVIIAVPSTAVREVFTHAAPHIPPVCDVVLAAKGLEEGTGLLPSAVAEAALTPVRGS